MRAKCLGDGTIAVTGTKGTESFNRIWAGVGWPENAAGYLCVLGERVDGRYHALWEKNGGLWELGVAAVEVKDRFLIDCIWVDARDAVATSYLRTLPGLCFHEEPPERGCATATGAGSSAKVPCSIEGEMTATVATRSGAGHGQLPVGTGEDSRCNNGRKPDDPRGKLPQTGLRIEAAAGRPAEISGHEGPRLGYHGS